jgi:uncharacterized protein YecT (DUF1311 family)
MKLRSAGYVRRWAAMTKVLLALMFYFLGGLGSALAADAPRQMPTVNAEVSPQPTYDEASARSALSSGDKLYCARVASGEHQLGECLDVQMEYAEHELNDTYRAAMAQLSPIRQNALKKEERGWIKRRVAECARQVKDVENCANGCGVPWTMRVVCMTKEAQARTKHLKTQWQR